jgi:neutral ceramidase
MNKETSPTRASHTPAVPGTLLNHLARILLGSAIIFILFNALGNSSLSPGEESLRDNTIAVGVARVNITPSVPVLMSGYASRTEPFKGVNDEIFAAATVFDDGTSRAALITAEVIGFCHGAWDELTQRIESETGIPREFIMIAPSHNHGGPSTRVYENSTDSDLLAYNRELHDKLVAVTAEAASNLQPALIGAGKGICKMNMNRRAPTANGGIRLGRNPYGPCDQEVGVVRFDKPDGTPFSIFVNWPAHATVMGWQNYMITGDWPGAARRHIESGFAAPVIATVTAGASGDIDPIYRVSPDFSAGEAEEIGMDLGREAIIVAGQITTSPARTISAHQRVITLPGKKTGGSGQSGTGFEPGPDVDVRLSLLRIGNIMFAGVSGELFTEIGMQIKELSPYRYTFVLTHCNGASGYLITDRAYTEGGYEVTATRVMPGAEELIVANMVDMISEIN